jgi:hypothetical protein
MIKCRLFPAKGPVRDVLLPGNVQSLANAIGIQDPAAMISQECLAIASSYMGGIAMGDLVFCYGKVFGEGETNMHIPNVVGDAILVAHCKFAIIGKSLQVVADYTVMVDGSSADYVAYKFGQYMLSRYGRDRSEMEAAVTVYGAATANVPRPNQEAMRRMWDAIRASTAYHREPPHPQLEPPFKRVRPLPAGLSITASVEELRSSNEGK